MVFAGVEFGMITGFFDRHGHEVLVICAASTAAFAVCAYLLARHLRRAHGNTLY